MNEDDNGKLRLERVNEMNDVQMMNREWVIGCSANDGYFNNTFKKDYFFSPFPGRGMTLRCQRVTSKVDFRTERIKYK